MGEFVEQFEERPGEVEESEHGLAMGGSSEKEYRFYGSVANILVGEFQSLGKSRLFEC